MHWFRIDIKGNGTCALSAKMPKSEELQSHPDYDVYMRSQRSTPHCEPDRLYKMKSNSIGQERRNETVPTTIFGSGFLSLIMPSILSSPRYVIIRLLISGNNPIISTSIVYFYLSPLWDRYIYDKNKGMFIYIVWKILIQVDEEFHLH